jgi:hypothetical protein
MRKKIHHSDLLIVNGHIARAFHGLSATMYQKGSYSEDPFESLVGCV